MSSDGAHQPSARSSEDLQCTGDGALPISTAPSCPSLASARLPEIGVHRDELLCTTPSIPESTQKAAARRTLDNAQPTHSSTVTFKLRDSYRRTSSFEPAPDIDDDDSESPSVLRSFFLSDRAARDWERHFASPLTAVLVYIGSVALQLSLNAAMYTIFSAHVPNALYRYKIPIIVLIVATLLAASQIVPFGPSSAGTPFGVFLGAIIVVVLIGLTLSATVSKGADMPFGNRFVFVLVDFFCCFFVILSSKCGGSALELRPKQKFRRILWTTTVQVARAFDLVFDWLYARDVFEEAHHVPCPQWQGVRDCPFYWRLGVVAAIAAALDTVVFFFHIGAAPILSKHPSRSNNMMLFAAHTMSMLCELTIMVTTVMYLMGQTESEEDEALELQLRWCLLVTGSLASLVSFVGNLMGAANLLRAVSSVTKIRVPTIGFKSGVSTVVPHAGSRTRGVSSTAPLPSAQTLATIAVPKKGEHSFVKKMAEALASDTV